MATVPTTYMNRKEDAPEPNSPAAIRADLMRRWFAVAISVGFAATIARMPWLNAGGAPSADEVDQLFRLFVAMTAVLLSWEGYFLSIAGKPLHDFGRFLIDFVLVLLYMVLLITSRLPNFWLVIHAITFATYLLWDLITIKKYRIKYLPLNQEFSRLPSVAAVYGGGLRNRNDVLPGPAITLSWSVYFFALPILYTTSLPYAPRWFALFVLVGLAGYRLDKHFKLSMFKRTALILGGIGLIWLHCRYFR